MLEFLLEFLVFSTLKIYGIKEKMCPIADWIRRGLYLYKYICGSGGGLTQKITRGIIANGKWRLYLYIYYICGSYRGFTQKIWKSMCNLRPYLLTKKDQSVTDRHTEYKIKTPKEKLHNIADGTCGRERQPGKKSLQVDSFLSHGWIQYVWNNIYDEKSSTQVQTWEWCHHKKLQRNGFGHQQWAAHYM